MKLPFIGPSYISRSVNWDCSRSVNLIPLKSETGDSKSPTALMGRPGLQVFTVFPKNKIRGSREMMGRAFFVGGTAFYELFSDGTFTERGNLITSTGFVSMSDNGKQLCLVDGANGYIFDITTDTFTKITDPYFTGANTVTFIDGYFMFNRPETSIYYISNLNDGLTGDPLDFASAEGSPDGLVAVITVHKEVWLIGVKTIEVVYNSGAADFPFQRISGAFIEYGCAAPFSVAKTANTVFWLGQDEYGAGVVWMANGYAPQRISTHAIEYFIQQFDLSDAIAYTYQEDGSYFYVINFTNSKSTIVYDVGLNQWHERAYFMDGAYSRHRPQTHIYAFNTHLVGDFENGNVYVQSLNLFSDAGQTIRYMRTGQHLSNDLEYIYYNSFQMDMEAGTGLITGGIANTDPQAMLQWSNDGGHTWSNEHWSAIGRIGEYARRVIWRRLGRARDRVFKLVITSTSKVFIMAAHAQTQKGAN